MRPHVVHWLDGFLPGHVASLIAPSWFTCVGLAGLVTLLLMLVICRRRGIAPAMVATAILWCYVAAVGAGILVPMLIDAAGQLFSTGHARLRWSGMTSFWGYLAGFGAVAIVCRDHGVPLAKFGDLSAAPMGVALLFARLGCFLGGCDYGKVTSLPWAVRFPSGSPAWRDQVNAGLVPAGRLESLPVHPTQLYEAALGLVIVAVAIWASRRRWARDRHGRVFLAAAATYAIGRIGIEALRGDLGRGIYFGLSSGQIFSLVVLAAISAGLLAARRRAVTAIASAGLVVALVGSHTAEAQPAPPPYGPAPAPTPVPDRPLYAPSQPAPYVPAPPPAVSTTRSTSPKLTLGALLGVALPVNRRPEQVPTLAGPSLSVGWVGEHAGVWLDFDSFGNTDASHGTVLVSGSLHRRVGPKLRIGGRAGLGATLVNFNEPAFRDVVGTAMRAEAIADYAIGDSWQLWVRPLSFDVLIASDLGGPITTWQMRLGVAYRFGARRRAAPSPPPASYPPPYPYPQPGQYPPPNPAPYPPAYPPASPAPYPPAPYPPPNTGPPAPYPPPAATPAPTTYPPARPGAAAPPAKPAAAGPYPPPAPAPPPAPRSR